MARSIRPSCRVPTTPTGTKRKISAIASCGWAPGSAPSDTETAITGGARRAAMDAGQAHGAGPAQRSVEIAVTLAIALFGVIVILGSLAVGVGWGAEGPKSGFFPFYLGAVIVAA